MLRALALLVSFGFTARADPVVVERVVARVEGKPILLSEIRTRVRMYLTRVTGAAQRAAMVRPAYHAVLERRIDEELVRRGAALHSITVSDEAVSETLERMAKEQNLDVPELLANAFEQGLSEREYRAEIRRQLLEQRLILTEVGRRREKWPSDTQAYREWYAKQQQRLQAELRKHACVEHYVRW